MSLDIILGSMFSGKTTEIIKYHNKFSIIYKTIIINHNSDSRYNCGNAITTHNKNTLAAVKLKNLFDLDKTLYKESQFILIDESQFFQDLNDFVMKALKNMKNILVVGLNGDCDCKPFMNLMNLIPYADNVKYLTSMCHYCETPTKGFMHYRLDKTNKDKVAIGGISDYVVLCRNHYIKANQSSIE